MYAILSRVRRATLTHRVFERSTAILTATALAACLAIFAPLAPTAQAKKYEVTDFARLPAISSPQLSPNGEYLALLQPFNGKQTIFIYKLGSSDQPWVIEPGLEGDVLIAEYRWATDDRLVVVVLYPFTYIPPYRQFEGYKVKTIATRTIAVNRDASDPVVLFNDQQKKFTGQGGFQSDIVDMLADDDDHILIAADVNRDNFLEVNKVNIHTGDRQTIVRGAKDRTVGFGTDLESNVKYRYDYDDIKDVMSVHIKNEGSTTWRQVNESKQLNRQEIIPVGETKDGSDDILVITRANTGRHALYRFNTRTNQLGELLFAHDKFDVAGLTAFKESRDPFAAVYIDDTLQRHYFSPEAKKIADTINKIVPGFDKSFEEVDEDVLSSDKKVLVRSSGPSEPPTYYLIDFKEKSVNPIGSAFPTLNADDMGEVKPYHFKARDGVEIPAYLTLPKGKSRNLPTIIMPHGGPRAQDWASFDFMAQLFASRGYAVVQPNFRGSTGYGEDFEHAGFGEWGFKMQDDVTDATLKVIRDGIADPDRVCIFGWSYGAYAAMMGVVKEPNLYKCGAAVNGVYDLIEVMNLPKWNRWYHNYWGRLIGDKDKAADRARMEQGSSAMRANEIQVPIFLAAGEVDRTVLPEQTRIMENALKQAGKIHEVHYYPHADHSFRYEPELQDMFVKLDAFLARHLK